MASLPGPKRPLRLEPSSTRTLARGVLRAGPGPLAGAKLREISQRLKCRGSRPECTGPAKTRVGRAGDSESRRTFKW
eukprot:2556156-Rhodomonas_salina.1